MAENTALNGALTVIADIRTDWATERATDEVQSVLARRQATAGYTLLRVGRPDGETGQHALERLAALRPDGFVLSGCGGVADIQAFDVMLRVTEAEHGIEAGSIALVAEVGENAAFVLSALPLKDVSRRLAAIVFDGASLTQATASQTFNTAASRAGAPLLLARATAVITARQAGLPCYELLQENTHGDPQTARDIALADGFSGVIARNAAQLAALRA
ncbi:aldolase/citrate lyase family protein [Pararhizobium polonicum]|uniref:aldolase/citrate lyase family protein n=1 Tax=Pararhizobium polonicum TaxID=1612624 RepID=UPI001313E5A7|nr:aldolase/citrate lyase family protein [Pararhizobium polonicum]